MTPAIKPLVQGFGPGAVLYIAMQPHGTLLLLTLGARLQSSLPPHCSTDIFSHALVLISLCTVSVLLFFIASHAKPTLCAELINAWNERVRF